MHELFIPFVNGLNLPPTISQDGKPSDLIASTNLISLCFSESGLKEPYTVISNKFLRSSSSFLESASNFFHRSEELYMPRNGYFVVTKDFCKNLLT